jgi:hypothetical protein
MKMSPDDRWLEGTRIIKPAFLDQSRDLDFLFGIVREGAWTLDHRGVIYEGLYYYSDGLDIPEAYARRDPEGAREGQSPRSIVYPRLG